LETQRVGKDDQAIFKAFLETPLLVLMCLASNDSTRNFARKIFHWRNGGAFAYGREQELNVEPEKNLAKLVLGLLKLKSTEDGTIEHRICVSSEFELIRHFNEEWWYKPVGFLLDTKIFPRAYISL